MRNTIVATAVAVLLISGTLGCKTASKMAWWKATDNSDVESTALAHSAPSLPADVAKQAEAFAGTSPSITMSGPSIQSSGGQAAPYSPPTIVAAAPPAQYGATAQTAPTAYPSTGASPYSATTSPALAATTPTMPPAMPYAGQGSVGMPYNPNAVPPAPTVASAAPVTPSTSSADRYGMGSVPSTPPAYGGANVPPVTAAAVPQQGGADRYGNYSSATSSPTTPTIPPTGTNLASSASAASSTTNTSPVYGAPSTAGLGAPSTNGISDRYATGNTAAPQQSPVTTAPVVASAAPYRPGGTASYEGAVEIATRPQPADQQVPNVTTPGSTPEPSQAPRYR